MRANYNLRAVEEEGTNKLIFRDRVHPILRGSGVTNRSRSNLVTRRCTSTRQHINISNADADDVMHTVVVGNVRVASVLETSDGRTHPHAT